jgi:hypothetical protein
MKSIPSALCLGSRNIQRAALRRRRRGGMGRLKKKEKKKNKPNYFACIVFA